MVNFDVGIHEIIQRLAILFRRQGNITPDAELHAVIVPMPKKEVALLRMLPRFGDVHRNPSLISGVEVGPAVIPGNFAGMLVCRKWESNFEKRWNSLRARHGDEK